MKTIATKTKNGTTIKLLSDSTGRGYNVLTEFINQENPLKIDSYFSFPTMVKEEVATDLYVKRVKI